MGKAHWKPTDPYGAIGSSGPTNSRIHIPHIGDGPARLGWGSSTSVLGVDGDGLVLLG